jgi:fluoride exporter
MSLYTCLLIMLGGAIGTLLRYLISVLTSASPHQLPWGTIAINLRLLVMVGICGGFTTFSSFSLQTFDLMRHGYIVRAAINIIGSVLLCVCAVALGHLVAAHFNGHAPEISQLSIEGEASFSNGQDFNS